MASLENNRPTLKKYILLLYIFLVSRHISLLVASLLVARNWSLAWAWFRKVLYQDAS
jgi:hypothetical protein